MAPAEPFSICSALMFPAFSPAILPGCRLRDPHQKVAEVLAFQEAHEGRRRVLQPLHDVLAVFDLTFAQPPPASRRNAPSSEAKSQTMKPRKVSRFVRT